MKIKYPVQGKRRREENVEEERNLLRRAQATREAIRQLNPKDLTDPTKTTPLPYPGYGYASVRPLEGTIIVGMPDLDDMLSSWQTLRASHHILALGPNGIGKSTRLRAFACILYASQYDKASKQKLLCIWNANRVIFNSIRAALLFCYCEEPEVVEEIVKISSTRGFHEFMATRESKFGEKFSFIVDAAQKLDVQTCVGELRGDANVRSERAEQLSMFLEVRNVCWGISPMSAMMGAYAWNPEHTVVEWMFDEALSTQALVTYLSKSFLGTYLKQFPEHETDVQYYAGGYPLFLDVLDQCCIRVAEMKMQNILRDQGQERHAIQTAVDNLSEADIVELLADQKDWDTVLTEFEQHNEIKRIIYSLKGMKIGQTYHSKEEMMDVDSRYVLNKQEGLYCSEYAEQLYIDAFRELEHKFGLEDRHGPWIAYARYLLKSTYLNWSEIGWLCERVCTSVVSKCGICIADSLDMGELKAMRFTTVPTNLERLSNGRGVVYIPNRFNFGCVDAVILYVDEAGVLHFIGLQVTTSLERHMHSEDQFMCISVVEEWIPSVLSLSRDGSWELHFLFICMESKSAVPKPENVSTLRTGVHYGTLAHTLHVRSFEDAFGLGRVGPDVHNILREFASMREQQYASVEPAPPFPSLPSTPGAPLKLTKSQVRKMKRRDLNVMAETMGLDPQNYKTVYSLVEGMKAAGCLDVK